MIYIFRNEMKKWHTVLWLVFASLALSGLTAFMFRKPHPSEVKVASVNGVDIPLKRYRRALGEVKMQIEMYRSYAKTYGVPIDLFLKMSGLDDPEKAAFDRCIKDVLVDQEKDLFNILLDQDYFNEEFIKMLPMQVKNQDGSINMQAYKFYLSSLFTTASEYEDEREEELKRIIIQDFIKNSFYIPVKQAKEQFENEHATKQFSILKFSFDIYLKDAEKLKPVQKELAEFFQKNKEKYRIGEKRKVQFWTISTDEYVRKIEVDEEAVQSFYEKNKSSLFRIPPKIKVRHILLKAEKEEDIDKVLQEAKNLREQLKQNPQNFENFAKKHSQDEKTAANGGVIDFFEKGQYEVEFDKAAFRLKENGEISDVIKTDKGYEIIQLVDRIAAEEKPIESVQEEIIKTIKARRAVTKLKSNIESVLYQARKDKDAISSFAKENKLKETETEWLTQRDSSGKEIHNLLAEKVFSTKKKDDIKGYFPYEKGYIIFQLTQVQDSFIPNFEDVEKEALEDYFSDKARLNIKNALKTAKREVLAEKTTLQDLSKKLKLELVQTDMIKKGEEVSDLKSSGDLIQAIFVLDDSRQLLKYKNNSDYYLIQLVKMESLEGQLFENEKLKLINEEKIGDENMYLNAFIASLMRNAKIEKSEKIQDVNTRNY